MIISTNVLVKIIFSFAKDVYGVKGKICLFIFLDVVVFHVASGLMNIIMKYTAFLFEPLESYNIDSNTRYNINHCYDMPIWF